MLESGCKDSKSPQVLPLYNLFLESVAFDMNLSILLRVPE